MALGKYVVINEDGGIDDLTRTKVGARDAARQIERSGGKAEIVQVPPCAGCGTNRWPCCDAR